MRATRACVRAEDSRQELDREMKELDQSDFEEVLPFVNKLEQINNRLKYLGETYKMSDLQMTLRVGEITRCAK